MHLIKHITRTNEFMNILFVSSMPLEYNFSSNMRNIGLIKGLLELKHHVDVCSYKPDERYYKYDSNMLPNIGGRELYVGKDIQVNNLVTDTGVKKKFKRGLRRIYLKLSPFDAKILQVIKCRNLQIGDTYDLMISSSDPKSSHVLAKYIYKNNSKKIKKWIQYWGDPFSDDVNKENILPNIVIDKIEKDLIKYADCIVYTSPITLKAQKNKYRNKKMIYTPTASPIMGEKHLDDENADSLNIGYFGGYNSRDRNILPLVDAIKDTNHKMFLYGETDIDIPESKNIIRHKFVGQKELQSTIEQMDVLVCLCNRRGTQIPGKIYHYGMTYKRVMVLLDGERSDEIREWLEQFNRYIICRNDKNCIRAVLKKMPASSSLISPVNDFLPRAVAQRILESIN